MEKIAIISDLHANLEAVGSVFSDIEKWDVRKIYCLGDLVDYGVNPNEVIAEIQKRNIPALTGNHDYYMVHGTPSSMNPYAQASHQWTKGVLSRQSRKYLEALQGPKKTEIWNGHPILLVHGSPEDPLDGYVSIDPNHHGFYFSDAQLDDQLTVYGEGTNAFYSGHIHIPFIKKLPSGKFAVNVGSVGQPRDHDPRAAYCITDGTFEGTQIVRVGYDIEKTQDKIRRAGFPRDADRLSQGR